MAEPPNFLSLLTGSFSKPAADLNTEQSDSIA
jgi:hypothetical protein